MSCHDQCREFASCRYPTTARANSNSLVEQINASVHVITVHIQARHLLFARFYARWRRSEHDVIHPTVSKLEYGDSQGSDSHGTRVSRVRRHGYQTCSMAYWILKAGQLGLFCVTDLRLWVTDRHLADVG